jgi:hypothetical protein
MKYSDETITRLGARYRVYVVNTNGRDWGHILRDGQEICKSFMTPAPRVPLGLALELRRRIEAGEFDEVAMAEGRWSMMTCMQ